MVLPPNLRLASLEYLILKDILKEKKSHCRLKVLNIFSVISYQTERSTNLLSLSECFEAGKEVVIHQKQFYYEIWFMLGNINDDVIMCTSAWREHILVNWVIQFYYFKKSISGCTFYSKKFIVLYRGETCVFQGHGQLWIVLPSFQQSSLTMNKYSHIFINFFVRK